METLHRRCAGLDVHQKEIVACRRIASGRKVKSEFARFPTTTRGLVELSAWLSEAKVTHVAMEATGRLLETGLACAVPRFQTDPGQRLAYS